MHAIDQSVRFEAGGVILDADVTVPEVARGVVLFSHGSGSGRLSAQPLRVRP